MHEWHLPGGEARLRLRYLLFGWPAMPVAVAVLVARFVRMSSMSCSAVVGGPSVLVGSTTAVLFAPVTLGEGAYSKSCWGSGPSWDMSSHGRLGTRTSSGVAGSGGGAAGAGSTLAEARLNSSSNLTTVFARLLISASSPGLGSADECWLWACWMAA